MTQNSSMVGKLSLNQQQKISSSKAVLDHHSILSIIDKSLKHLNQISQANIVAQQLYIELLKQKKTMKFDQIKKIYFTLTQGIVKYQDDRQKINDRKQEKPNKYYLKEIKNNQSKLIIKIISSLFPQFRGLIRLCWRSIQKLIKKITYYMINENHLSVISKTVLKLIHLNQQFVRRFQKLKNSSMLFIIQIMEKLIQQNSILQKKIYDILLNRGYVVSLDQFYKLNGYDAQHRQSYYAKQNQQISNTSSDQQQANKIQQQKKQQQQTNKKQIRKKKGFRIDCRYSWKEKLQIQQKQDKQKFNSNNKTNYQIRQSFQKFIGDFLQNQNLNQILINYKFQQTEKSQTIKPVEKPNEESLLHKKIFQNKIQTVLNQLKSHNVKVSSKLLQIIDNSSNQAINTKVNYGQKKIIQRKNSIKRQSGIVAQRKLRQSYLINDRKIVNENFFRQLLRRNTKLQQYVNQQLYQDTKKIQQQLQNITYQNPKVNPNVFEFNKKQEKQANKIKKSRFSTKKNIFMFNQRLKLPQQIQNPIKQNNIYFDENSRYLQTQLNCKYKISSKKNIVPQIKPMQSVSQKIRIIRQEWQLKNQKNILQVIQNSSFDPINPIKMNQMLQILNKKKNILIQPFKEQFRLNNITKYSYEDKYLKQGLSSYNIKQIEENNKKIRRLKSECNQHQQLKIKNITNESLNAQTNRIQTHKYNKYEKNRLDQQMGNYMKRIKTQQSPTQLSKDKFNKYNKSIFDSFKQNTKRYQVFDRRLRRFIKA